MSHRTVIFQSVTTPLQDSEVRDHLTTGQTAKVDQILAAGEPGCSDEQFRFLQRRLAQAFCAED